MAQELNDTLIAIMNDKKDYLIAQNQYWYRIPVFSSPKIVKEKRLKYLSFFLTKKFGDKKYTIFQYGKVTKISKVKRWLLFPNEINNKKSNKEYFKIEFEPLQMLPKPIISSIPRRWLFVPTTLFKLLNAQKINDVFNGSHLEERMWTAFLKNEIQAEREYAVTINKYGANFYYLDFAIFCKKGKLDVECNGFHYHGSKKAIEYDKNRNNLLESKGWSVLRFTTEQINNNLEKTILIVKETINQYGGLSMPDGSIKPMKLDNNPPQLSLF
jgi:very-short-patch-repair endonuclease